ncbi:MAG: iron ABC transporter permease [Candidatus Omnitrophota bacterium]
MKRTILIFIILSTVLAGAVFVSALLGAGDIPKEDVIRALFLRSTDTMAETIVWHIRLPRIAIALLIGAGLAACGSVFQGMLRNPLADPYTLGISGGAALGATIAIVCKIGGLGFVSIASFIGALLSVFFIYMAASRKQFSVTTLILCGVVMNFLFSSLVLFIFAISRSQDVHGTIIWMMGDLGSALPEYVPVLLFPVGIGIALLIVFARDLNILSLGEERALHLGLEAETTKKILFTIASLITGACVACSGIIGFVGLIIPHMMRQITGADHRVLIPASAFAGAVFLILCDTLARTIIAPIELPVGVITGIVGGIFFLILLFRKRQWEIL